MTRLSTAALATILAIAVGGLSRAQFPQPEPETICVEGTEPSTIQYGTHTNSCQVVPVSDIDTFTFAGEVGDVVRITVAGADFLDPALEVLDPVGAQLETGACATLGQQRCCFDTTVTVGSTGTHALILSDNGGNDARAYTLQIERIPAVAPPLLLPNTSVTDSINPGTDHDFFAFWGAVGTTLRVAVSGDFFLDPFLQVLDPSGHVVAEKGCSTLGQLKCSFTQDISPAVTGMHQLVLRDANCDDVRGYSLSLQCLVGDCTPPSPTTTTTSPPASTTTAPPATSTTSSTLPAGCDLEQFPIESLGGVECSLTQVEATLSRSPQPECLGRCKCSLRAALERIRVALNLSKSAATTKRCKRKLDATRRIAGSFAVRVGSIGKRGCFTPPERSTELREEARALSMRAKALFRSQYCKARQTGATIW